MRLSRASRGEKQGISLTGSGDSLVSDEECEQPHSTHSQKHAHFGTSTHAIFSRMPHGSRPHEVLCPRKNISSSHPSMACRTALFLVYPVDRYTSHESFSRTLSPCAHTTLWLKVSQRAHSLHPHAIHDVTCLSVRWLFLVLFSSSLSRLYLFSIVYLFSALHINFHNAEPAED